MNSLNNSKNSLSKSSNSIESNDTQNEKNNVNFNLNYPYFFNKKDSESFDDDEDNSKEKEEGSLKSNDSINKIYNEVENKINQQFVEKNDLLNLIGGNSKVNANDLNKDYFLFVLKHDPEEKIWAVTDLTNGNTQYFTAFGLFEFLCDKIEQNLDLNDYKVYREDFQDIPQFETIEQFNILSEFLDDYYQSSIFKQEQNHILNQEFGLQNNNQFNQFNQNHNQNNNNNYEPINNWIHTNFNICNNNGNGF